MGDKWWEKSEDVSQTKWIKCVTDDGLDYYVNTETNESQWEKPPELQTEEDIKREGGDWYWAPHETEVFAPGKMISSQGSKVLVEIAVPGSTDRPQVMVKKQGLERLQFSSLKRVVADLTLLDDMAVPLILHNLRERYKKSEIYTNIGNILVSINPYEMLPIYTPEMLRKYREAEAAEEMPPHVYGIAADALYGITSFSKLQSIIISGESGAGKTEATKRCLQFLANAAGSVGNVEQKILKANPVLEAFGNAKTLRNDNSSRFGKYLEVYFDGQGRICDSKTENYLLEKVRVVQQQNNERNFHIFYQIVKAGSSSLKSELKLKGRCEDYAYLRNCTSVSTIDDHKEFADVENAFKELAFDQDEVKGLYSIAAAILHLGNVKFREAKADEAQIDSSTSTCVRDAASLLGLDHSNLSTKLCTKLLKIRGQQDTTMTLDLKQASDTRDALCKFIYSRAFDWLVERVNTSMNNGRKTTSKLYIGILDIFGFEIFEKNSFEQLCINYTNEMLQQHFNNNTFKLEEELYRSEGIDFVHVDFIDNEPMIDLIESKKHGILPMLDEELKIPRGSDKNYLSKLNRSLKSNNVYHVHRKDPVYSFEVQHYAGRVVYTADGFLEKNRDTLTEDLTVLLKTSTKKFINTLYPPSDTSATGRKQSLGYQFRGQLRKLMGQLNVTEPHYIRCIKPNETKSPKKFVGRNCFEQLTYSGVFEAVAIRKKGFPFRLSHENFASRYKCTLKLAKGGRKGDWSDPGSDPRAVCQKIIQHEDLPSEDVRMGKTRVLYRAAEYRKLELDRSVIVQQENVNKDLEKVMKENRGVPSMSKSEKDGFLMRLAKAVRVADKFRISSPVAEQARAALEKYIDERMGPKVKRELQDAKRTCNRRELERLVAFCDENGFQTSLVRECRELLEKIVDADNALDAASKAWDDAMLDKAIAMCDAINHNAEHVRAARQLRDNIIRAKSDLSNCMRPPFDHKYVKSTTDFCASFGYATNTVRECEGLLRRIDSARRGLIAAYDAVEQYALENALGVCDQPSFCGYVYECELVNDCRKLWQKVSRINEESARAQGEMIEDQVRTILKASQAIGMRTDVLDYFSGLCNGNYDDFLKAQYDGAKTSNDPDRAIRVMKKRMDIMVDNQGHSLPIERFMGLKQPAAWAKEKTLCLNREKLAASMLRFTPARFNKNSKDGAFGGWLHSPITSAAVGHHDKDHVKMAKKKSKANFMTVQKVMGQRKAKNIEQNVMELLDSCLTFEELRDEAFIYVIKQLTDNSNDPRDATRRGMELMALMLCVFPPSMQFEPHLEWYFRRSPMASLSDEFNCKFLLRRRVYEGANRNLPHAGELAAGNQYESSRYVRGGISQAVSSRMRADAFRDVDYHEGNTTWCSLTKLCRRSSMKRGVLNDVRRDWGATGQVGVRSVAATPQNRPLPRGWEEAQTDEGEVYYINTVTNTSQWDKPTKPAMAPRPSRR